MGVALFCPFDAAFECDQELLCYSKLIENEEDAEKITMEESNDVLPPMPDEDFLPDSIKIDPECRAVLDESPLILTTQLMQEIEDRGLPVTVKGMAWKRLYSLRRDGDYFHTFLDKMKNDSNTLIVAKTDSNEIFGGFVDGKWQRQKSSNQNRFYGTGQSFLFSVKNYAEKEKDFSNPQESENRLNIFKWTGENDYNQFCDVEEERIAMGGGQGGFGFCIQDNFTRGSTQNCSTYKNDLLVSEGYFEICDFEVFGFVYSWV